MCGRFSLTTNQGSLIDRFEFRGEGLELQPRYNIAPSQDVLTVVNGGPWERVGEMMRWGLIPFWAKEARIGYRMINARGEEVENKPAFRAAFKRRRCLVPADGFYEWKAANGVKTPMRIVLKGGEPFAFAGLWESWTEPGSEREVRSCTIITTPPNELMATIHNRMPVILSEEAERLWLEPGLEDPAVLKSVLAPFPAGSMDAFAVSSQVNSVKNQGPELTTPT